MRRILPILLISTLSLSACTHYKFPWVYRIDVEQGNIIEEKEVDQLEIGMTEKQVIYVIGTPLGRDTFDQSRWDYYYSYRTGKGKFDRERLTLYFTDGILSKIEKKEYESQKLNY